MNAVILAGGRSQRLKGIVATGHKPLLVFEGEPLIARIVRQVQSLPGIKRVVVVASPMNVAPIVDVLDDDTLQYIIQPTPLGPGDALLRGLESCDAARALVVMGDNLMPTEDLVNVANTRSVVTIGVAQAEDRLEALRFTRVDIDPRTDELISEEGSVTSIPGPPWTVWSGPLALPIDRTRNVLEEGRRRTTNGELKIGPYLAPIAFGMLTALVPCSSRDVGVSTEVTR